MNESKGGFSLQNWQSPWANLLANLRAPEDQDDRTGCRQDPRTRWMTATQPRYVKTIYLLLYYIYWKYFKAALKIFLVRTNLTAAGPRAGRGAGAPGHVGQAAGGGGRGGGAGARRVPHRLLRGRRLPPARPHQEVQSQAAKIEVVQSRRRPLLGPTQGWKCLLVLSHLRHY